MAAGDKAGARVRADGAGAGRGGARCGAGGASGWRRAPAPTTSARAPKGACFPPLIARGAISGPDLKVLKEFFVKRDFGVGVFGARLRIAGERILRKPEGWPRAEGEKGERASSGECFRALW